MSIEYIKEYVFVIFDKDKIINLITFEIVKRWKKLRIMLLKEVIGHEDLKKKLIQTVNDQRISHAQLFQGTAGQGALALAIAYAQYISCENRQENDSCGVCPSCHKYQKLIHPDLHFVFPLVKTVKAKKGLSDELLEEWRELILDNPYIDENLWYENLGMENKQGFISIEESKDILRKLNLKTFESEFKIMIIWLPEKMNAFSANKLLKFIEEPPEKTILIMVSQRTELILPTILSRVQLIKIPSIDKESLSFAISKRLGIDVIQARDVARISNGSFLEAIRKIESSEDLDSQFENFVEIMRLCYQDKGIEIIDWVDKMFVIGREKQKSFLNFSLRLIRENYMLNLKQSEIVYLTKKEYDFSQKFSSFIHNNNAYQIAESFNEAITDIEMNANARIVFLDLALKLVSLIRN